MRQKTTYTDHPLAIPDAELERRFMYHPPTDDQVERYEWKSQPRIKGDDEPGDFILSANAGGGQDVFFRLGLTWPWKIECLPADCGVDPDEKTYLCRRCGKPRTAAEGGATFSVCDECWSAIHPPAGQPRGTSPVTVAREE